MPHKDKGASESWVKQGHCSRISLSLESRCEGFQIYREGTSPTRERGTEASSAMATAGASRCHSLRKCRHMSVRRARTSDWGATTAAGATAVPRRIDHRHECLSRPCLAFRPARDAHRNPGTLSAAPVIRSGARLGPSASCVPSAALPSSLSA